MRGDAATAQLLNEAAHVISFVGAQRDPSSAGAAVQHGERRLPLGGAGGLGEDAIDRQAVTVLHQCVAHVAEPGRLTVALLVEPRLRISGALMGLVGSLLLMEATLGVAARALGVVVAAVLAAEALQRGPGLDQCAVH